MMSSAMPKHRAMPTPQHRRPASPERSVSRRFLPLGALATSAVAGAGAAVAATPDPGDSNDIGNYSPEDLLLLRRFSYGTSGLLARQVRDAGGARAWFTGQLSPEKIYDNRADAVQGWFPKLSLTPIQAWTQYKSTGACSVTQVATDLARSALCRRISSNRQVLEVMSEFWSNLLHVPPSDKCWPQRASYDETIRANALGTFEDLLKAAILHPAMLLYLDNYESTKDAPNENLGRELLECHTVGIDGGYDEDDVQGSTRILTGLAVDRGNSWAGSYNALGHYTGTVRVMGFSDDNSSPNGRPVVDAYLTYLAHHPSTARRVALKLATRFVGDVPPPALVSAVAAAFTASGTDIVATITALVDHPLFAAGATDKVRTPTEDFVATVRALRIAIQPPQSDGDLASQSIWLSTSMGQTPFDWPTPDGFPDQGPAWASATRMLGSWGVHTSLASGNPRGGATYRPNQFWLPELPATFEKIVNFAASRLLFQDVPPAVLDAACQSVGVKKTDVITAKHLVAVSRVQLLIACLLDSPLHMKR